MEKFLGIDKLQTLIRTIRMHGGVLASIRTLFRIDDLPIGTLIGEDKYGNKYYENPAYFYGRNRWVVYSEKVGLNYDGSQVPAEWFGWLHYKTDLPPHLDPTRPKYKWMSDHTPNLSGTSKAYMPYSTTRTKIEGWQPPK
ncbi:probable NADH dehydrogenase [ubiquinone] 1 alpha subcomplex subunit 12 [Leptopilina boulardi]|uniref:probable NADH dehydrogenase [ubiquinone] 1 alpha subcomplex subunit 12 n=1 Tax=Leptopilina boulardi TaxID=63433 RepID=UPI0021F5B429|nr:probable NADH dehydrogenase [ubiquinone] 1 alpha subcomplex subunit 12 [Leptopilina boulardi]